LPGGFRVMFLTTSSPASISATSKELLLLFVASRSSFCFWQTTLPSG
jgi:hypothetical protein